MWNWKRNLKTDREIQNTSDEEKSSKDRWSGKEIVKVAKKKKCLSLKKYYKQWDDQEGENVIWESEVII